MIAPLDLFSRFAAFGAGDTTSLRVYRQDVKAGEDNENNHDDDDSPTVKNLQVTFCKVKFRNIVHFTDLEHVRDNLKHGSSRMVPRTSDRQCPFGLPCSHGGQSYKWRICN